MRILTATVALILGLQASAAFAQARPLTLEIDHSTRVQLSGRAGSVIVGNPAIADVTVVDANTLFITGKGYGATQIVAVDQIGRTVFSGEVVVTAPMSGQVRLWRGTAMTEMACGASCAPSVRSTASATGDATAPTP